ncbi:UDP-N-acetylmuramate dehydrogenase [Candidatus Omnitrophota bacterium]
MSWNRDLKSKVKRGEPLAKHSAFKIGGRARFFSLPADLEELKRLLIHAGTKRAAVFVIGAGSNILISDKGVNGLVVRLSSPFFKRFHFKGNCLDSSSGVSLFRLLSAAEARGLSGLEFLAGIPGTLGGALAMNAGITGQTIADLVENVSVMYYNGTIKTLTKRKLRFGYRKSNLNKCVILGASLKLKRRSKGAIRRLAKEYLQRRWLTQDRTRPSLGCIFRNPAGLAAGKLIDSCGLKGMRVGGAAVSRKHANFIVNRQRAKARDVKRLMQLIKNEVKKTHGLELEPEIKIWD